MKTFQQFLEDASNNRSISKDNVIPLGKKEQDNLNKAKQGQFGPRARGVTHTPFRIVPIKNP